MRNKEQGVAYALLDFVEGSKMRHMGCFLRRQKPQKAGWRKVRAALKVIDQESTTGRALLIPLLKHVDYGVRADAAQFLVPTHRALALPVLHDIDENCVTDASWTAAIALFNAREPSVADPKGELYKFREAPK